MGERARITWGKLTSGYWFVPSLMAFVAALLAYVVVKIDVSIGDDELASLWLSYTGGPAGARSVLSSIASSMINVTGVVFSITVVVLSLTTQQYGTYILRSFMQDRANQIVLGAFISTFIFCLLVLRTVRGEDGLGAAVFIPHLAVTLAIGLAIGSLALLIFFIHHLATSIQSSSLVARASADLIEALERLYPETEGADSSLVARDPPEAGCVVSCGRAGYIQGIDGDELLEQAVRIDAVIVLLVHPGRFVVEGDVLAMVAGVDGELAEDVMAEVRESFIVGRARTIDQDALFGIETLVELGVRALSPGINNVTTALECVDRLRQAVSRLVVRPMPTPWRQGSDGFPRLYAPPRSFATLVDTAFLALSYAARSQPQVLHRMLDALESIARLTRSPERRRTIEDCVARIAEHAATLEDVSSRQQLLALSASIVAGNGGAAH